jgi:hypothetical protein
LRDLLGKAVTPKKSAGALPLGKTWVGTYVDDSGKLAGLCLCDLGLASSMGAALALIPAGAAAETVRVGTLSGEMMDNLREVLNVMASLFGGPHVRFSALVAPPTAPPAEVAALAARPGSRLDLDVAVAGYLGGKVAFLVS